MMNKRDYKFFDVARTVSLLSDFQPEHIGAVLVLRNEIITTGYNRLKTHPMQAYWAEKAGRPEAIYTHAEMSCLSKSIYGRRDLSLGRIYVFRQTKNREFAMAKPCEICTMALKEFGIKHIFYTTDEGYCEEVWEPNC